MLYFYTKYNPSPSLIASPLIVLLLVRTRSPALSALARHGSTSPLPQILPDNAVHAAHIMPRLAHVIQPRPSRALGLPLHDLNALHVRAVDLVPHLAAHARQVVAQQHRRVDLRVALSDVQADAGKGFARFLAHEKDVAHTGAVGVFLAEEASAGTGRVQEGHLRCGHGGDGIGASFARGGDLGSDGDFAEAFLEA